MANISLPSFLSPHRLPFQIHVKPYRYPEPFTMEFQSPRHLLIAHLTTPVVCFLLCCSDLCRFPFNTPTTPSHPLSIDHDLT